MPHQATNTDLMTIDDFAAAYRVDSSVVRSWIRTGSVQSIKVGNRRFVRRADLLRPIVRRTPESDEAIRLLLLQGVAESDAHLTVDGMHVDEIRDLITTLEAVSASAPPLSSQSEDTDGSTGQPTDSVRVGGNEEEARRDEVGTGRTATVKKGKRRGRGTA